MKSQNTLTLCNAIFILLFAISTFFDGFLRSSFHLFAYLIAILIGVWRASEETDKIAPLKLSDIRASAFSLPLFPPILALTMLVALGTSALFSLIGIEGTGALGDRFGVALLEHALLPAVFEELLFRYLPLILLGRENPRGLILTSAIFFALGHVSILHLPYAFLAGVCYMTLVLLTGSIWPSILAHFLNNLLSLSLTFFPESMILILVLFALVTLASVLYLILRRRDYIDRIRPYVVGRSHEFLTRGPILYAACLLLLCVITL